MEFVSDHDYEIAASNGISRHNVRQRVYQYGWSKDRAIIEPMKSALTNEYRRKCKELGLSYSTFRNRIYLGWSVERALSEPSNTNYKKDISSLENEIWKDTEYRSYQVSNFGRVRNKNTLVIKNPVISRDGYINYHIWSKERNRTITTRANRLVAQAFIPNPNNYPAVDHLDMNKANNHVSNLEWVTNKENTRRLMAAGKLNGGCPKVPIVQYDTKGKFIAKYESLNEAAKINNLSRGNIWQVVRGKRKQTGGFVFKCI